MASVEPRAQQRETSSGDVVERRDAQAREAADGSDGVVEEQVGAQHQRPALQLLTPQGRAPPPTFSAADGTFVVDGYSFVVDTQRPVPRAPESYANDPTFPLPFVALPRPSASLRSRRARARLNARKLAVRTANDLIAQLNALYFVDTTRTQRPKAITTPQAAALAHIVRQSTLCRRFIADATDAELPADYSAKPDVVPLNADRVALPNSGEGAQVPFSLLPLHLQQLYDTPTNIVKATPPTKAQLRKFPARRHVVDGHYARLLKKLQDAGMVDFSPQRPTEINGVFGVQKDDDTDRFIVDCRRANLHFESPLPVELPSPEHLAELTLLPGHSIFVGKNDVNNMFHRIATPEWMRQYFGLPSVSSKDLGLPGKKHTVWPRLVSLPMGWSHSVLIAQAIHEHATSQALHHLPSAPILRPPPHSIGGEATTRAEYVDDTVVVGTQEGATQRALDLCIDALRSAGLPSRPHKRQNAGETDLTVALGVGIHKDGWLLPSPAGLARLVRDTRLYCHRARATAKQIQRLVGRWVWVLLLHRPTLAAMDAVFQFSRSRSPRPRLLPPTVVTELRSLVNLVPLLFVNLAAPVAPVAVCTDASELGGGVVTAPLPAQLVPIVLRNALRRGWHVHVNAGQEAQLQQRQPRFDGDLKPFLEGSWTTAISTPWNHTDHIVMLEAHAYLLALRHIARHTDWHGSKVALFTDSMSLLGAAVKGRSSSKRLLHLLRRSLALVAFSGIRPLLAWVPTAHNPADAPSRNPAWGPTPTARD